MRLFTYVAILFYSVIITFLSSMTLLFASKTIMLQDVSYLLESVYADDQLRYIVALISSALILLTLIFTRIIFGERQKEKTIAFDNPAGRVSIALSAVEDLIRRLMQKVPEVKEVKSDIVATKKGLDIEARLVLRVDSNIPEITSRLQDLIRNKIQDLIGLEGKVTVRIHINKIVADENQAKKNKDDNEARIDLTVPFQGYRN